MAVLPALATAAAVALGGRVRGGGQARVQ
jgi:hypothetical protein